CPRARVPARARSVEVGVRRGGEVDVLVVDLAVVRVELLDVERRGPRPGRRVPGGGEVLQEPCRAAVGEAALLGDEHRVVGPAGGERLADLVGTPYGVVVPEVVAERLLGLADVVEV